MSIDDLGITFGAGTMPDEVAEAAEEAVKARPRGLWKPERVEVEEFFGNLIEDIKRAQGHDGGPT